MAGNVFGLNEVYDLQKDNATDLGLNIPGLGYGYLLAGEFPVITTVDRYDLATETMSQPGTNLPQGRAQHQSFADPNNYGYYGGGYNGPPAVFFSNTFRYDFSNETITDISQNAPEGNRNRRSRLYNPSYGYFVGGSPTSKIDRLDFSTQTYTSPGNLPSVNAWAGTVSSASYGYIGGGETPSLSCTIQRMDFSVETFSSPGGLPQAQAQQCQNTESDTTGYFGGGYIGPPGLISCRIYRLEFSTEVASVNPSSFAGKRSRGSAIKSPNFGYFCNGDTPPYTSAISRLDFATNTVSENPPVGRNAAARAAFEINRPQVFKYVPGNNVWKEEPNYGYSIGGYFGPPNAYSSKIIRLEYGTETATISPATDVAPVVRAGATGVYNANYGYAAGGQPGGNISSVSRLEFSTETMQRSTANLTIGRSRLAGASDTNYGYTGGGHDSGDTVKSTIDKLDFSNETVSANPGKLNQARLYLAGTQSDSYGYFGAGRTGPSSGNVCTIERLDFSSGTVSNPPASTTYDGTDMSAFASATNAYFFSGNTPGKVCTISRLDFVTDTSSDNPGQLSQARTDAAGVSNFGFGYAIGGVSPAPAGSTIIDRVDFTTDTVSTPGNIPGDGLRIKSATVNGGVATRRVGKATYGYWAGGYDASYVTTIDRMEFSTETIRKISGELSIGRGGTSTVSNGIYAYIGGGISSECIIDRLDFSNDTVVDSGLDFPLSSKSYLRGSVQNSNYGYFCGGYQPPTGGICRIDRLDFSSETIQSPGTYQLLDNVWGSGTASSSNYGYLGGCRGPSTPERLSVVSRIDFNSETTSTLAGQLSVARGELTGVENTNYGYFAGGLDASVTWHCVIDRIDFTTETVSANPGSLTQPRRNPGGSSASEYGYFAGGDRPPTIGTSTIDRLDFAAETVSLPSQSLTGSRLDVYSGFENG